MGNTNSKKSAINLRVSNPPNRNGNGAEWENLGNVFLNLTEGRGTFYLKASTQQIEELLKSAKDGIVERKFGIRVAKPKAGGAQRGTATGNGATQAAA